MESLSLLIVDDEPWIRRGLAAKVRKSCLGFEDVHEAGDATGALRVIESKTPDVILCDIRMPGVDGLAFCEKVARSMPDVRLILVSGFDEFDFARRALQLGAVDYLLKPVEGYGLRRALEKAIAQIKDRRAAGASNAHAAAVHGRKRFRELIEAGTHPDAEPAGGRLPELPSGAALFQAMCVYSPVGNAGPRSGDIGSIIKQCGSWEEGVDIAWCERSEAERVVIVTRRADDTAEAKVGRLSRALLAHGGSARSALTTVGVSMPGRSLERCVREATLAMRHRVLVGCGTVIGAAILRTRHQDYRLHPDRARVLHDLLQNGDRSRVADILSDIRREVSAAGATYRSAANVYQHLLLLSRDWSGTYGSTPDWPDYPAEEAPPLYRFCDLEEAFAYLADLFSRVSTANASAQPDDHAGLIYAIKEYIDIHFAEKPSLKDLAVRRHMNPTYLSELFHRTMGITFQEYLMKTRIDEAKLLLASGECRMSEVAERSGFSDHTYFRKVFRRLTGVSPQQFHDSHLNERVSAPGVRPGR